MRSIPNVGKAERRSQNENIHGTGEYYPYLALHRPIPICSVWVVFSEFLLSYIHVFCGFFSLLSVVILVLGTVIGILSLSPPTQLLLGEHPAGGCSGWIKCTTCPYCGEREWEPRVWRIIYFLHVQRNLQQHLMSSILFTMVAVDQLQDKMFQTDLISPFFLVAI